jgi:uncharacterized protein (TIGR02246 family)
MSRLRSQFLRLAFFSVFLSPFAGASDYIIRNVTVIEGTGKPAKPKMTVMVSDGKITAVLPAAASDKGGPNIRELMRSWTVDQVGLSTSILSGSETAAPKPADPALVRDVLEHYRTSWLKNDPDGVRACFTQDAVLMPHHGLEPIVGMKAINDFWFPPTNTRTTILSFARTTDEIEINGTRAYARGRSEVAWRVEDKGTSVDWRTAGNYMTILKKQADGKWLISHLIWDDLPNERKK